MSQPRRFDHEEAVLRYLAGESTRELADYYGVTVSAIWQVAKRLTDPSWAEHQTRYHRDYQRRTLRTVCPECGGPCWRPKGARAETWSGKCLRCTMRAKAISVREDTLRCSECLAWKPDEDFPRKSGTVARRGRHQTCRACSTIVRQRNREKRKLPCVKCGRPRMHPKDMGGRHGVRITGLCQACYQESPECFAALARGSASSAARRNR